VTQRQHFLFDSFVTTAHEDELFPKYELAIVILFTFKLFGCQYILR